MLRRFSSIARPVLSIVRHPFPLPSATPAAEGSVDKFAVVEFSGTQYKITLNDVIAADHIESCDIGQQIPIEKVLLIGTKESTFVGRPYISGARVIATVEEKAKDKKVIAFKMRRRKNSKRTKGFRRQLTILRITDIIDDQLL